MKSRAAPWSSPWWVISTTGRAMRRFCDRILSSYEGVVVSNGICPRYSDIDTYAMVACAIDEAIRNNVAVGGNPDRIAGLDNFCWPDPVQSEKTPDGEYKLAQLVRANLALYDHLQGLRRSLDLRQRQHEK